MARFGGWTAQALLVAALPLTDVSAQAPQPARQASATAPATWIPPVHVAPQRIDFERNQEKTINLSDQYPGVFEPDPADGLMGANESTEATLPANYDRAESRPQNAVAQRGQGSSKVRRNAAEPRLRNSQPTQAAKQAGSGNRMANRQVTYQQSIDQPGSTAQSSPQSEVQPAFVADGEANQTPQRTTNRTRPGRGGFTSTREPAVRDAGMNAEFAELEQPLSSFAQTPTDQQGQSSQSETADSSVLDNGPGLPGWQNSEANSGVPARPASMPRTSSPNEPLELPGETGPRDWNPNMPPPAGVMNQPESIPDSIAPDAWQDVDTLPRPQKTLSCDELRSKLLSEPLTDIALDVSPQLPERGELPSKPSGDWIDHNGQLLARGQMVALSRGYVIVDTAEGRRKISVARLGDSSLAMVASAWQLPGECAIGQGEFGGRCWTPQLSTWYASNLCHKPLYFENVQLERYGHSAGPIMGPIRTSAHFFGSLALWPYHTAINPPNECVYALGHYRPGNCAPWLVEPFPFSARGAIRQGAAVTGAILLF